MAELECHTRADRVDRLVHDLSAAEIPTGVPTVHCTKCGWSGLRTEAAWQKQCPVCAHGVLASSEGKPE